MVERLQGGIGPWRTNPRNGKTTRALVATLALSGCGPSPTNGEPACDGNALLATGELRVAGTPCDPCDLADEVSVWITLRSACGGAIEWTTPTLCLIGRVDWESGPGDAGTWDVGYCGDALRDWVVTPDQPLEHEIAPLAEIVEGLAPGDYSFVVWLPFNAGKDDREVHFDATVQ